jgi:transcription elongation factor GreB
MTEKNYITPDGYKKLVDELTELATVERPKVVREVSDAAAEGDRSENAAYIYGKRRLREIDRRMGFLQRRLEHVQVIKLEEQRTDRVFFGAWVEVEDEESESRVYQIVGVDEVEADKGRISWKSPVGRALIGKRIDETVTVRWHAGERELTVVSIAYTPPQPTAADAPPPSTAAPSKPTPAKPTPSKPAPSTPQPSTPASSKPAPSKPAKPPTATKPRSKRP